MVTLEVDGGIGADHHSPEQLEPGAQWHTDGRQTLTECLIRLQLRVILRIIGDDRFGLIEGRAYDALFTGDDLPAIIAQKASAGDRPQKTIFI